MNKNFTDFLFVFSERRQSTSRLLVIVVIVGRVSEVSLDVFVAVVVAGGVEGLSHRGQSVRIRLVPSQVDLSLLQSGVDKYLETVLEYKSVKD
jgi:hypothetical protein